MVGIRVVASSLSYSAANDAVSWNRQGTSPYPINEFTVTASGEYFYNYIFGPYFVAAGTQGTPTSGGLRVVVSSAPADLVPEPQEYAIVFGLFALGFVIVLRHFQKKRQAEAAANGF